MNNSLYRERFAAAHNLQNDVAAVAVARMYRTARGMQEGAMVSL